MLIVIAGTTISMLSGDSGILNRASEARVLTEIGSFRERINLAQMSLQADISSRAVSNRNYRATTDAEFRKLVQDVANEIGVQAIITTDDNNNATINTEGYTVVGYLDVPGENGADGEGYIAIWYTSNSLRSGIKTEDLASYGIQDILGNTSRNEAVLVAAIKVENYTSELSNIALSSTSTANEDITGDKKFVTGSNKTSLGNDLNFASSEQKISAGKYAKVTSKYADNSGETATIPAGFTVSKFAGENTISTGLVIYDIPENELNTIDWTDESIKEDYNQFVWVPCSGTSGVTYEKKNGLATTWRTNYSGKQSWYTSCGSGYVQPSDERAKWHDEGGDLTSVEKYGGFYVARYEAGLANATNYIDDTAYNYSGRNNSNTAPVSKKNNPSWNGISQINAKDASSKMYQGNTAVESSLIDSYAWDTIVEWMKTESGKESIGLDSTNFGNYYNNYSLTGTDTIYAYHRYDELKSGASGYSSRWAIATKYKRGNFTSGGISITSTNQATYPSSIFNGSDYDSNHNYTIRKEVATGSLDTKVKNIYDMAGNMWEWTTEVRDRILTSTEEKQTNDFSVFRGGSFSDGGGAPVSFRHGHYYTSSTSIGFGFHTVLYIK